MKTKLVVAVLIVVNLVAGLYFTFVDDLDRALLFWIIATFLRVGQNTPPAPPRR